MTTVKCLISVILLNVNGNMYNIYPHFKKKQNIELTSDVEVWYCQILQRQKSGMPASNIHPAKLRDLEYPILFFKFYWFLSISGFDSFSSRFVTASSILTTIGTTFTNVFFMFTEFSCQTFML